MKPVNTRKLTSKQIKELLGEILVNQLIFIRKQEEIFEQYNLFPEEKSDETKHTIKMET